MASLACCHGVNHVHQDPKATKEGPHQSTYTKKQLFAVAKSPSLPGSHSLSFLLMDGSSLTSIVASLWSAEWLNLPWDSLYSFCLYPEHPDLLQAAGINSMGNSLAGQRGWTSAEVICSFETQQCLMLWATSLPLSHILCFSVSVCPYLAIIKSLCVCINLFISVSYCFRVTHGSASFSGIAPEGLLLGKISMGLILHPHI